MMRALDVTAAEIVALAATAPSDRSALGSWLEAQTPAERLAFGWEALAEFEAEVVTEEDRAFAEKARRTFRIYARVEGLEEQP